MSHLTGSSPLARGLRGDLPLPARPRRIIPARAGFTSSPTRIPRGTSDHPRSRGVYPVQKSLGSSSAGSSPLARGLRDRPVMTGHERGIIPARAGFTDR